MNYKELGHSGVKVSEVILGTWGMAGDYFAETEDKNSIEAIRSSLEAGINTFDTAELYGWGRAENVLASALEGIKREDYVLISKVWNTHASREETLKALEGSCRRLNTDYLDVYFLHYPVAAVTIKERMSTLMELKKSGKIRAIGLSNFNLEQMKEAMNYGDVDVIQPCYSLVWRYIDDDILPFCIEHNIGVIPYSALAQGILGGKYTVESKFTDGRSHAALFQLGVYERALAVTALVKELSEKYGKTCAQGAINWLIHNPAITAPIIGAKNRKVAVENVGASGWQFSKADYDLIDGKSREFTDELPNYKVFFQTEIQEN